MKIRKAIKEDVYFIVAMLAADKLGQQREDFSEPLPESYYKAFTAISNDPNHELVVLEAAGEVLGCLQLSFLQYLTYQGRVRAQVEGVRVRADQRGRGLGERLFRWAIERAQTRGAHVLQLTTDKQRPETLTFYKRLGFNATHEGLKMHF